MRKFLKYLGIIFLSIIFLFSISIIFLYLSADAKVPDVSYYTETNENVITENGYRKWKNNYLRQSETGLWEMKIAGEAFERGRAVGVLSKDLLYFQEKVFVDQIKEMIPSESYLKFLRFFLTIYNRKLGNYVTEEYRKEIYGISLSCTDEYNMIGMPYERQLNYHGAHDIGHAMQDFMLVGCSSFATWNQLSEDSSLFVGRNFDFYMGDDFAKNKVILFVEPEDGYRFASVTWAGMMGVLSGMNEKGLTVTINAAKSSIPFSSATPISLLVREILQYASSIEDAYEIAKQRKTFVSESILVASAEDNQAVIIEKSPETIDMYQVSEDKIICTNHFQSEVFKNDKRNIENIETTDSYYRYQRLEELLEQSVPMTEQKAVEILRNRYGLQDKKLGLTNEMAINQLIAHHSVVFKPAELQMWVSTSPWQLGKYVMYDLKKIFSDSVNFSEEIYEQEHTIAVDTFIDSHEFTSLLNYRKLSKDIKNFNVGNEEISSDLLEEFENSNPDFFYTYELLGDYYNKKGDNLKAKLYFEKALTKPIGRLVEKDRIQKKIME